MLAPINDIRIPDAELEWKFVRAGGPGGQHVNKTSTAVELRFRVEASSALPEEVKKRLLTIARTRISEEGILVIRASRFRSQKKNREDARERLAALVHRASIRPRKRKKTLPSPKARERRLEEKRKRSKVKRARTKGRNLDTNSR